MSIINNSHVIGVDSRNLVLKTRGTLHVKVGDRYYEIDFRNLQSNSETTEKEQEQYVFAIEKEANISDIEYPGDNKLIIGTQDGSMFVTLNGEYISIAPKTVVSDSESASETSQENVANKRLDIDSAFVSGSLIGVDDTVLDFANNSFATNDVVVRNSFSFPKDTVLNRCCKSDALTTNYRNYDFIELNHALTNMRIKNGVMIKSNISSNIQVSCEEYNDIIPFEANYTYIVYTYNDSLTYTRL